MENYVKALLYAYPSLDRMKDTYAHHIRTSAVLSCDGRMDTEKLTEYLLKEILHKRRLEWLKVTLDRVLNRLNDLERALIESAFFRKKGILKVILHKYSKAKCKKKNISERSCRRFLNRTLEKIKALLSTYGVNKQSFEEELLPMEMISKIYRWVCFHSDKTQSGTSYSSIS